MGPLTELIRVVEIGDRGEVAGKLLADAGADVIRVEPPHGSRGRHVGPFVEDRPGVDASLHHAYYNTNKRGVTLDVTTADGAGLWRRLVESADMVIDSAGPGSLDAASAGREQFGDHERLVWCSITPFGLTGPWRDWQATDLISLALGGPMMSTGYDDHELPPIRSDGEHSLAMGGEFATAAILAALLERQRSGLGQLIDVSIHEAVSSTVEGAFPNWEYMGELVQRQTGRHSSVNPTPPWQYRCTDGAYVLLMGGGVPRDAQIWDNLLAWMDESASAEDLHDPKYKDAIFQGPRRQSPERRHIQEVIGRFVQTMTAEQVYRRSQSMRLPWGTVRLPEDNLDDPHWEDRDFFAEGELAGFDRPVRYPGAPYRFTETPVEFRRRAPLLGEHNYEVYVGELGLSEAALHDLAQTSVI